MSKIRVSMGWSIVKTKILEKEWFIKRVDKIKKRMQK